MNTKNNQTYRFYIKTLGCKVNQYESQAMRELLVGSGFKECLSKEIADIYIINTCTVTHKADTESRHWAAVFHKTNPKARIIVTGCCAESDGGSFSFLPGISNIVKNEDKANIVGILTGDERQAAPSHSLRSGSGQASDEPHRFLSITDFKDHAKAFVKIQDGCGNLCAYCKVPYVRGSSISKPVDIIRKEVATLASKGFKEIVLTGICLGAWGSDIGENSGLVKILEAITALPGDFRIRLSSLEPKYVTEELMSLMAGNRRICRHLHIPVQSGDDDVLARMNRPYTAAGLKDLIIKVKKKIEGIGVTTDVLIGFPGETDKNFRNTVNLIKEMEPVRTHIFPFSGREGTPAASMGENVPHEVMKARFHRMKLTALTAAYLFKERFIGSCLDVLVEAKREKHSGRLTGYSDNYIKVIFEGPDSLIRTIVPVKIEELNLTYTLGTKKP